MKAILAIALIALSGHSRSDGAIVGWVTDNRNVPIPAAHVDVTDNETGRVAGSLTGDDGRFTVTGLVAGHHYSILTRCIGFAPRRMEGVEAIPAGVKDAGHLAIFELAPIEVRISAR
jgi:hypothetical protein